MSETKTYIYGPIPSRRLGQSLGVDLIPLKTCNWNCVYCQLGRTKPLTNERREYVPTNIVMAQIEQALATHEPGEIDFISFVGAGEPTLHSGIGTLIRQVKEHSDIPVAVITNGATLYLPDVRSDLSAADVVMPTINAGNNALYQRIARPHPDVTFARYAEGLVAFRGEFLGKLWIEVMLLKDVNDTEPALRELATVLRAIQPDEVHITLPTRPPSETWIDVPDNEGIMRATAILGDIAHVVHPRAGSFDLSGHESVVDAVIGIITRHPMSQEQLEETLSNWVPEQVEAALAQLAASGEARKVDRLGRSFWTASPSHFPDPGQRVKVALEKRTSPVHRIGVTP